MKKDQARETRLKVNCYVLDIDVSTLEAKRGWLRYAIASTLNPKQHRELYDRSLEGERWDDMIDELIVERKGL